MLIHEGSGNHRNPCGTNYKNKQQDMTELNGDGNRDPDDMAKTTPMKQSRKKQN